MSFPGGPREGRDFKDDEDGARPYLRWRWGVVIAAIWLAVLAAGWVMLLSR